MNVWHQAVIAASGPCVTASGKLQGQKHYLDITPESSQLAPSQINKKVYLFSRERNKFWITVTCVVNTDRDGVESENKRQARDWDPLTDNVQ